MGVSFFFFKHLDSLKSHSLIERISLLSPKERKERTRLNLAVDK